MAAHPRLRQHDMQRHVYNDPVRRKSEQNFTCVICSERWPESAMRIQDGIAPDRRCPNDFAPNGGSIARTQDRAAASDLAASITARYAAPPKWPGWFENTSDLRTILSFSPEPRRLTRGGASAQLTITGRNLATGDTITYGDAGITNASAAVLTPVTYDSDGNTITPHWDVLVLTVQASGATPVGLHTLEYSGQLYRNIFDVRAA